MQYRPANLEPDDLDVDREGTPFDDEEIWQRDVLKRAGVRPALELTRAFKS